MKERYIEIKFYYYIWKFIRLFNYNVLVLDILDSIIELAGADKLITKNLVAQVRNNTGVLRVYKEEVVYVMRKLNYSSGDIQHLTGMGLATVKRYIQRLNDNSSQYVCLTKKLSDQEFKEVSKVVTTIEKMMEAFK